MKLTLMLVMMLIIGLGCASKEKKSSEEGFVVVEKIFDLWKDFNKNQPGKESAEIEIKRAQLPKSFTTAVSFIRPEAKNQDWRWTPEEKDKILSSLKVDPRAGRNFELINTSGANADLRNLRTMAAQQGADALLIVKGHAHVES
ncbi:MAG: hypothetical protein H0V66_09450, partial [Bdellovibrionales bacterium]|nr:hypothetical protein [Bdellovibrionales bacterium]